MQYPSLILKNQFGEVSKNAIINGHLSCSFVVDATNGNGLGIRSLKGNGITEVFMNTSAALTGTVTNLSANITAISGGTASLKVGMPVQGTAIPAGTVITAILSSSSVSMSAAATGSHSDESITYQGVSPSGLANPNPPAGVIIAQLSQAYAGYVTGFGGFVSPSTGSPTASPSANAVVYIAALGSSSLAQWQASGLPAGITPAVGATFIANGTAVVGGGTVIGPGVSGIGSIEVVGDPNQTCNISTGALIYSQCLGATDSSTTTLIAKAPAAGSVIGLNFQMLCFEMVP